MKKSTEQLFEAKVRKMVKEILSETQEKTNHFLKINIKTNKDGSVEIYSQGETINLPTQQHVQWLKNNL